MLKADSRQQTGRHIDTTCRRNFKLVSPPVATLWKFLYNRMLSSLRVFVIAIYIYIYACVFCHEKKTKRWDII